MASRKTGFKFGLANQSEKKSLIESNSNKCSRTTVTTRSASGSGHFDTRMPKPPFSRFNGSAHLAGRSQNMWNRARKYSSFSANVNSRREVESVSSKKVNIESARKSSAASVQTSRRSTKHVSSSNNISSELRRTQSTMVSQSNSLATDAHDLNFDDAHLSLTLLPFHCRPRLQRTLIADGSCTSRIAFPKMRQHTLLCLERANIRV